MATTDDSVISAPRNTVFQIRINQEIKSEAEKLFSSCGLTLTDAINLFLQQSLNVGGLPFEVRAPKNEMSTESALQILMQKLEDGKKND